MSESKHTPGPWGWQNFGQLCLTGQHSNRPIVLDALPHGLRCNVNGIMRALTPDHPDARLIASAPLLLDALKVMLHYAEKSAYACEPDCHPEFDKARAAIAAAEGEV